MLCLAAGTWATAVIVAEPVKQTYGLDACVCRALEQSGQAINARVDQAIARTQRAQARSLALPHLSASASYTRLDEVQSVTFGESTMQLGELDNYEVKGEISQLLYAGGQVGAALRAAELAEKYAECARLDIEIALARDVRVAFSRLLLARETVSVHKESVSQLVAFVATTERKHKQDTVSRFDVLSARVRLANEQPLLIEARNNLDIAVEDLCRLLDLESGQVVFEGELLPISVSASLEALLGIAMTNNPSLRCMEYRVALGREDTVSARSDALPDLTARAEYNGANSSRFVSYGDDWQWHWNAGVVLSWNIWDGDLTRQTIRRKGLEYNKLLTNYDEMGKTIALRVRQAYLEMNRAQESIEASEGNVALAEKALDIARTRYDAGAATHLEFTDTNLALTVARLEWLRSLHGLAVAVADLEYACGGVIGEAKPGVRKGDE